MKDIGRMRLVKSLIMKNRKNSNHRNSNNKYNDHFKHNRLLHTPQSFPVSLLPHKNLFNRRGLGVSGVPLLTSHLRHCQQ